jgi:hypothetical protein
VPSPPQRARLIPARRKNQGNLFSTTPRVAIPKTIYLKTFGRLNF